MKEPWLNCMIPVPEVGSTVDVYDAAWTLKIDPAHSIIADTSGKTFGDFMEMIWCLCE